MNDLTASLGSPFHHHLHPKPGALGFIEDSLYRYLRLSA